MDVQKEKNEKIIQLPIHQARISNLNSVDSTTCSEV